MKLEELDIAVETESAAIEFAIQRNLLPQKRTVCPICCVGHVGWYKRSNEGLKVPFTLRCSRKRCRKKWSVTKDTWFFGSHLTVRQNFMLIYFWIRGDNISEAAENLKLSKTTVMDYYQFCREIDRVVSAQKRRVCFLEGFDKTTNDCFLIEIQKTDVETIVPLLRKFVRVGSTVITSSWESFSKLDSERLLNALWDHPIQFVQLDNFEVKSNKVKCMWRSAKRFVETESREIKSKDLLLFQYLYFHPIEYLSAGDKFDRFLQDIAKVYPGPFKHPMTAVIY